MRLASLCFVLLATSISLAADTPQRPAAIKAKATDVIPEGGYVDHKIDVPKSASVIWRISPAPVQRTNGLAPGHLIFGGKKGTTYTVTAIIVDFDSKTVTDADYVFTFGTPKKEPPPADPPETDPPTTPAGYYFLIVRPDGPAAPEFTRLMKDPAWATLRKAGHLVKDKTVTEAAAMSISLDGVTPPAVVTLKEDATSSKIVRSAIPAPSTSAGILDLPKGIK